MNFKAIAIIQNFKIAQPGFKTVQKIIEHKLMVPDENNG